MRQPHSSARETLPPIGARYTKRSCVDVDRTTLAASAVQPMPVLLCNRIGAMHIACIRLQRERSSSIVGKLAEYTVDIQRTRSSVLIPNPFFYMQRNTVCPVKYGQGSDIVSRSILHQYSQRCNDETVPKALPCLAFFHHVQFARPSPPGLGIDAY